MKKTSLVMMDTSLPFTWHQMSLPWSNQWIKPLQEEIVTKAIDRRWEWCISHQLPEVSEYENCHRANRGVMGWNQGIHAMQVMGEDHAYLRTKGVWRSDWRTGRWRWRWASIYTWISGVGIEYGWKWDQYLAAEWLQWSWLSADDRRRNLWLCSFRVSTWLGRWAWTRGRRIKCLSCLQLHGSSYVWKVPHMAWILT